VKILRHQRC